MKFLWAAKRRVRGWYRYRVKKFIAWLYWVNGCNSVDPFCSRLLIYALPDSIRKREDTSERVPVRYIRIVITIRSDNVIMTDDS